MRSRSTASAPFTLEYELTTSVVQARVTSPLSQLGRVACMRGKKRRDQRARKGQEDYQGQSHGPQSIHASLGAAPARAVALPSEQRHDGRSISTEFGELRSIHGEPIRTVVAATDFSFAHRAARRAAVLAKVHGAALHLLHVLDSSSAKALQRRSPAIDVEQPLHLEAERALNALADDVGAAGGAVSERLLREGRVMDEILAAAASSDLVVLGPRGVNPLRDFFLGSTAERMARMIERPMLVVKQDPQIPYENVLVPVDFSDYSAPALRFASEIAPSATLHLVHVLRPSSNGTVAQRGRERRGDRGLLR